MNTCFYVTAGISGLLGFAFVLTLILTSVIVGSSLKDIWLKPGEQVKICKGKEFTAKPQQFNIKYFSPNYAISTDKRITKEIFDGTVTGTSSSLNDITKFHAGEGDTIDIDFDSLGYNAIEVYYWKKTGSTSSSSEDYSFNEFFDNLKNNTVTAKRRKHHHSSSSKSHKSSSSKNVRYVAYALNGTNSLSGSATLPGNFEYGIALGGSTGTDFSINITFSRKYYYSVSGNTESLSSDLKKISFNSEKVNEFCAILEMPYDDVITDPENSKNNIDLFCAERYSGVDICMIGLFTSFFFISLIALALAYWANKKADSMNVEMGATGGSNGGSGSMYDTTQNPV